jgi:hypothetical protein
VASWLSSASGSRCCAIRLTTGSSAADGLDICAPAGCGSAINDRRAGLLDAMDEQPTSLPEWACHLQHRVVDHLADVAEEPEMSHGQADELAWTAAMALEAAFMLATRAGDQSTLHEMLDEATRGLVDALDHGHDDSADWLQCATHTGLDMPDAADNDEQPG